MMDVAYGDTAAHDRYACHRLFVNPQLSRAFSRIRLNISAQIGLLQRSIADRHEERWVTEPRINILYDITSSLMAGIGYNYSYIVNGNLSSLTHVPFYSSYNYLQRGNGYFTDMDNHGINATVSYRGTSNNLMASLNFMSSFNTSDIYRSAVIDGLYTHEKTGKMQHRSNYHLNASLSKRFLWWMANAKLSATYGWNNYKVLQNDVLLPLQNRNASTSLSLSVSPVMIFSADLSTAVNYTQKQNRVSSTVGKESFLNFSHAVKLFLMPGKWQIAWNTECTHSNDKSMSFNLFSDVSVLYRTKTYDIGIYLNNIFGNSERRNRYVDMIGEFFTVSYLRPREMMAKVSFNF